MFLFFPTFLAAAQSNLQSSKLFTGTQNLINDATTALLVIIPLAAAAAIGVFAFRKMMANEQEAPMWNKRIVGTVVAAVVGVLGSVIVKLVLAYYS